MAKKREVGEKRKSKVRSKIVCTLLTEVGRITGAKGLPCSSLSALNSSTRADGLFFPCNYYIP